MKGKVCGLAFIGIIQFLKMIVSISGFDGVGKTTSVELVSKMLCERYDLKSISALELNGNSEVYEELSDLDRLYNQLKEYDIITTRFYMRSPKLQELQTKVMFAGKEVFEDTELIKNIILLARTEAQNWYDRVIKKLVLQEKIVIFDRYYYDEVAYRSMYSMEKSYIDSVYSNYPKADVAIFLSAPIETILKRNSEREDMATALFKSNKKMAELYMSLDEISRYYNMSKIEIEHKEREMVAMEIVEILLGSNCFKRTIKNFQAI